MDKLITVKRAADVTEDYKKEAEEAWTKWDSKNKKKFPYNYTTEERVLILSGSATLTPEDGEPIKVGEGDAVTFHKGFKCKWEITKRMKKYYALFGEVEDAPAITCDVCDADCVAESYFVKKEELDICPKCYKEAENKCKGAEHQKNGEKCVEPPKKKQKKSK
jgi:uncharacterized cupin superfamily protein